jgi:hypothetical protein
MKRKPVNICGVVVVGEVGPVYGGVVVVVLLVLLE